MRIIQLIKKALPFITPALVAGAGGGVISCARMGAPDGGWYDERPPQVVSATPADRGTNVDKRKVTIRFSEFIKLENAMEKVVISPPQKEMPEIKATGKSVEVKLLDSLQANTTYTIDFSDAISDNNEGNPMGNYTYSFSTGNEIDTLEVSGYVVNAQDLEPIKGILVGLYKSHDEGVEAKDTMIRVSRADSRGHFIIRGVAPGRYTIGALNDMDGDYSFSQKSEKMAFSHEVIVPNVFIDRRQDTIWQDQNHIKDISVVQYNHYTPDDIVLRAFDHELTERHFIKAERKNPEAFTLFFTAPLDTPQVAMLPELRLLTSPPALPRREGAGLDTKANCEDLKNDISALAAPSLRGLLSPAKRGSCEAEGVQRPLRAGGEAFIVEPSLRGDTITYWLRDTALVNMDTLRIEMQTLLSDTLGNLQPETDTLEILSKVTYAKRMKAKQEEDEKFQKKVEKEKKRYEKELAVRRKEGLSESDPDFFKGLTQPDTIPPVRHLKPKYEVPGSIDPDGNIYIHFSTPLQRISRDSVHLYVEQDSIWYRAPFTFEPADSTKRSWRLYTDWIPEAEYSFEVDTLAFEDIYGLTSEPYKTGLKVESLTAYASLFVEVSGLKDSSSVIMQLLDGSDKVIRSVKVEKGTAEFYYVKPATYYLRAIIDRNGNGRWDTGDYYADRQPEEVYYNPQPVECKAKWDLTRSWNLTYLPLNRQKPASLIKQKADKEKTIQNRNAQRAMDKGVEIPVKFRQ